MKRFSFKIEADDQVVVVTVNGKDVSVMQLAHAFTSDLEHELRKALGMPTKVAGNRPMRYVVGVGE